MNKFLHFILALGLVGSTLLCSCSDDEKKEVTEQKVLVKFSAKPVIEDTFDSDMIKGLNAVFTNMRNQDIISPSKKKYWMQAVPIQSISP